MTEQEWLDDTTDAREMLAWLTGVRPRGTTAPYQVPSERKCRLLACAIWRLAELGQVNWWNAEALVAAEQDAEGLEPPEKLLRFNREISPDFVGEILTRPSAVDALHSLVLFLFPRVGDCRGRADGVQVADAIRCHIINPFRPVTLPVGEECGECAPRRRWQETWCVTCHGTGHGPSPVLTPLVRDLAEAAYQERREDGTLDPDRLLVLSDALEEAGVPTDETCCRCGGTGSLGGGRKVPASRTKLCDACGGRLQLPHPLLAHLRSPGPHYRGCWAIDLLTGRG